MIASEWEVYFKRAGYGHSNAVTVGGVPTVWFLGSGALRNCVTAYMEKSCNVNSCVKCDVCFGSLGSWYVCLYSPAFVMVPRVNVCSPACLIAKQMGALNGKETATT